MRNTPPSYRSGVAAILAAISLFFLAVAGASAAITLTWTGAAGDGNILTAGNWSPSAVPGTGDTLVFTGSATLSPSLSVTGASISGLSYSSTAPAYTLIGPGTYTLGTGGITNNSTFLQTITNSIALSGAQTWSATSGGLLFNGVGINLGAYVLTLSSGSADTMTISDVISGTGKLTKSGNGTLILTGTNTFTGGVTLSSGTMVLANSAVLGTGTLTLNGGVLGVTNGSKTIANPVSFGGSATYSGTGGNLTLTGSFGLTGSRTITINGGILTLANTVSNATGTDTLTEKGTGLLVLAGSNTFTSFALSSGTVDATNNYALGTGAASLGTATFESTGGPAIYSNAVTLGGNTIFTGSDTIAFNGAATMTGNRTLTLDIPSLTFNGGISQSTGAARSLAITGTGTLILSGGGADAYTGTTTMNSGTLILDKSSGVTAIDGALTIGDGAGAVGSVVTQLDASNQTLGTAALSIKTDGVLNLQSYSDSIGAITMTGGSIIGSGTLTLGGNLTTSAIGTTTVSIGSNLVLNGSRTFTINNNGVTTDVDLTIAGNISDGSASSLLTKAGSGMLALDGSDSYSGGTTVSAGGLAIASASSIGTGPLSLGAVTFESTGGAITMGNTVTLAGNTIFGGTGALVFTGSSPLTGTRTLTISNSSVTFDGAIGQTTTGYGITQLGTGALILGGGNANSFTGTVTVDGGTLLLEKTSGLAIGGNLVVGSGTTSVLAQLLGSNQMATTASLTVNTNGVFDLNGNNQTLASATIEGGGSITMESGTLTLTGNVTRSVTGSSPATIAGALVLGGSADSFSVADSTASQDLIVSAIISGNGFTKSGAGLMALDSVNTYSGLTNITAGTLQLGTANAMANTSAISVSNGATLDLNSYNEDALSLAGAGSVTMENGTLTLEMGGTSTTFIGKISGAGGLVINGNGSLSLGGTDTYTGSTLVNSGTLQWIANNSAPASSDVTVGANGTVGVNGASDSIGSLTAAGSVVLTGGTLTAGGDNASTTISGPISGTGNFVKAGSGLLTLTGSSSMTGTITVAGGSITISGLSGALAGTTGVTIANGATLTLDDSEGYSSGRLNAGAAMTLAGGTFILNSSTNGSTETVGALNASGGASNVEVIQNGGAGTTTSLIFTSLGNIAAGATVNFSAVGGTLGVGATGPEIFILGETYGTMPGWATVNGNFAEYFADGVSAFSNYYLGSDGINVNDATKIVELSGSSPSTAYTLTNAGTTADDDLNLANLPSVLLGSSSSQVLNLAGGGLIKSSTEATLISGPGELTAGGTANGMLSVSVDAGQSLTISSSIINNAGPDGIYGDGDDGSVSLSMSNPGTLILSGSNTYTGSTFLNGGTLQLAAGANLGTGDIVFGGGALVVTSGFTAAAGQAFSVTAGQTGTLDIAAGQTVTTANGSDMLTSGAGSTLYLTGSGGLIVQGPNPDFDGAVTVNSGSLELQNALSLGGAATITLAGGSLDLLSDSSLNFGNNVTVTANATINAGPLDGAGGTVTQTLGTLSIGGQTLTTTGSNGASLAFGAVTLTGNTTFDTATANASLGSVSGAYSLTKTGSDTLTLAAASSYTGPTNIDQGTLLLGASGGVGQQSNVTVSAGALFDLGNNSTSIGSLSGAGGVALEGATLTEGAYGASTTYSGVITGSGGLTKNGTGTFTLSGANSYTGSTTINGGILALGASNVISGSSSIDIAFGAALDMNGYQDTAGSLDGSGTVNMGTGGLLTVGEDDTDATFSGSIVGTGTLTKIGTGLFTLDGTSNFTGSISVMSGTLGVSSDAQLGNSGNAVTFGTGGLEVLASIDTSRCFAVGSGATIDTGSSTLLCSGAISGNGTLTEVGSGTLLASGSNAYSGGTQLDGGTFTAGNDYALGSGAVTLDGGSLSSDSDAVSLGNTLTFTGANNQIVGQNGLTLTGPAGGSGTVNVNFGDSSKTVVLNPRQSGGFAPAGIEISSGTLLIAASQAIGAATNLVLDGGVFSMEGLTGATQTLGSLTLEANSTIDFSSTGGGGDTVQFSSLNLNGFTLTIDDWNGNLYSIADTTDLGSSSQDRILFTSLHGYQFPNIFFYDNTNAGLGIGQEVTDGSLVEIVPVPEPRDLFALAFYVLIACPKLLSAARRARR